MACADPSFRVGPRAHIAPLQEARELVYSSRELPAGCAEILPINGGVVPTAGEHSRYQYINRLYCGAALAAKRSCARRWEPIMKPRQFLQAAGLSLATTAVGKPAIGQTNPAIKWRITSSFPKSLDIAYGACETIARIVAEATDNQFQIQPLAAGEIVPSLQAMDALTSGTVEACHTGAYYYFGKEPALAFFCAVPFGLNTRQQNA
jgi:hypothetical protein